MSERGYSTASQAGHGVETFRERADRGRAGQGCLVKVLGVFVLVGGLLCLSGPEKPLGVMLVVGSLSLALYGAGRTALSRRIARSADYWSQGPGCVQFGPSRLNGLLEYLPAAVAWTGALTAVGMQLFSAVASPNGVWTIVLAVVVLLGWLVGCVTVPTGGRGAPEIVLTPDAVWIWAGGNTRVRIPWEARPNLEASMTHRMRPHAVITGGAGGAVNFPIFVVPIGHVQLQSVLEFYSIHAELRGELGTGQGLQRVRALMIPSVQKGERTASSGVPMQASTLSVGVPASATLSVGAPASPTPAHGAAPGSGSPYEGIQYGGPRGGQPPRAGESYGSTSAYVPVPGSAEPFSAAPYGSPTPSAPAGEGVGDAPVEAAPQLSTDVERSAGEEDQREKADSSKPSTCEEADQRAKRAPWRFLIWAVIILVGFTYATSGRQTAGFLLGMVLSLVLLIHSVALAAARRSRTAAPRRWTRSSEGICLRNTWFVQVAVHVEAALMALGGLLAVGLLAVSDRSDRGTVVVPFLLAMVFLIASFFMGLSKPLPGRRTEIVLDAERIRFAVGTSRESLFWWADRPRLVGRSAGGNLVMENDRVGRIRAEMDTLPLTSVQLQRVVAFYSHHPELCPELATEQGLARVQGLTGPASVAPQQ